MNELSRKIGKALIDHYDMMQRLENISNPTEREGKKAVALIMGVNDIELAIREEAPKIIKIELIHNRSTSTFSIVVDGLQEKNIFKYYYHENELDALFDANRAEAEAKAHCFDLILKHQLLGVTVLRYVTLD